MRLMAQMVVVVGLGLEVDILRYRCCVSGLKVSASWPWGRESSLRVLVLRLFLLSSLPFQWSSLAT